MAYFWAWEDEAAGAVRSRCFPVMEGIEEDEATGSAAISLCAELGRELTIHQGEGSLLHARPLGEGRAEVGGRVVLDEVREYPVPSV
jgi:predicted PhzF superfamily epimerase YddE/YHI9